VETIGFIGLGNMGAPMAGRLLAAGYPLVVHDARASAGESFRARGARWADTPAAVASAARTIITIVPSMVGRVASEIYRLAVARGMAELDHTAVARLIEEWAGIQLRSKPGDPA
jgi:3-hydroxyisobutyrate dehydrogenase-like beta-hydroxyacid dehydrogenase